ncbi:heterokaryon incompatibility, partial [Lasiosphaeria miniovina]
LPTKLPLVIRDAVTVAKRLEILYLWVDRYCIDQTNETELAAQIKLINLIYGCTLVTIFAAAGEGPEHGLPGITKGRDEYRQPCAKIGDQLFSWTMPSAPELVAKSKWNTRGWTYQEIVFSKSQLILTDDQAFLE